MKLRVMDLNKKISLFLQSYARSKGYQDSGLKIRSGKLRNSIFSKPKGNSIILGTGVIYGRIQELGGEIKPKKAKRLWIPLPANMMRAGVLKFTTREAFEQGYIKNDIVFVKGTPVFVLKDKVFIKPKRYLYRAIEYLQQNLATLIDSWIKNEKVFERLIPLKGGAG